METTTTLTKRFFWKTIFNHKLRIFTLSFVLLCFNHFTLLAQNGVCKAKLQVEKNRNSRSVPKEGTIYRLEISNESIGTVTFNLRAENLSTSCVNNDGSATSSNVNLNSLIMDLEATPVNHITLNAGETKFFLIKITANQETPFNRWNCTKVLAQSVECSNYELSTILHSYVSNPNEE